MVGHDKDNSGGANAPRPRVTDPAAWQAFNEFANSIGLDPADPWVGGYVDYEWDHLRLILDCYGVNLAGKTVLEFGCNVGASSIILALLGAKVTAVDISQSTLRLAELNARQYGVGSISFLHVPDTRRLPFPDEYFDAINCNSVIEYLDPAQRPIIQRELDRVLSTSGLLLVFGTSSRLWPREVHSRRWLTNYLPRVFDRIVGTSLQRGVFPWTVRYGFGDRYNNLDKLDGGAAYHRSRLLMGTNAVGLRTVVTVARVLGLGPGLLVPNISCVLRKEAPSRAAATR